MNRIVIPIVFLLSAFLTFNLSYALTVEEKNTMIKYIYGKMMDSNRDMNDFQQIMVTTLDHIVELNNMVMVNAYVDQKTEEALQLRLQDLTVEKAKIEAELSK